jgi:adenylate cyclase
MLLTCYQGLKDSRTETAARNALEQCERVLAQDPDNGAAISFAVGALAALGEAERAKSWIDRALLIDPDNLNMRYNFACALSILDEREAALDMLESALSNARGSLGMADIDPDLENIRGEPRYQAIIADAKARIAKAQAEAAAGGAIPPAAASTPPRS